MRFAFTLLGQFIILALCGATLASGSFTPNHVSPFDSPEFCTQNITTTCNTTLAYIDDLNGAIRPYIEELVKTPYFRYFKLDLDKQCKFWNAEHFCATENCAVEILPPSQYNWSDISDENLRPSKLGQINRAESTNSPAASENQEGTCEDLDYCHLDDDHHCVYVNLLNNPERFTGYGGSQSFDIWKAIYSENCFPNTNPMSMTDNNTEPERCIEKNLFYRLISGMHASIAVHLSNEFLCSSTGEFYPDLKVFMERVGKYNDRLSNVYFNYALLSQALSKLSTFYPIIQSIENGNDSEKARQMFLSNSTSINDYRNLFDSIVSNLETNTLFDPSGFFKSDNADELKSEFRARFRNVSAIMDCVGCDRCRMWGKLQTIGYGTALKILFESDDPSRLKFRRIELVALINTFDRLSKSVEAINNFKKLYLEHMNDVMLGKAKAGDYGASAGSGFEFPFVPTSLRENKKKDADSNSIPKENEISEQGNLEADTCRRSTRGFKEEIKVAFDDVKDTLFFVLRSYRDFPFTMYKYSLVRLDHWWNKFIAKPEYYLYYEAMAVKDKKEGEEYENLFDTTE